MKRIIMTLTALVTIMLDISAQDTWSPTDEHQYNDETVVYATLQLYTWSAGYGNQDYSVAAFIGDECRGIAEQASEGKDGKTVFAVRVLGDREADKGQPIRFEIRYNPGGYGLVYDVTPSVAVSFDGESWGQPSQPILLQGKGFTGMATFAFNPATINVGEQVDIVSLFQGSAMPKYFTVSLSDESVASLDGTVVTGLKPGKVNFTVNFPGISTGNTITVIITATGLNILNDELRIDIEKPETLQPKADACYELLPVNTTESVAWLIDNEAIIGFDAEGRLIPLAVGDTYITPVILADDGAVRLRPAGRIHVIIYENVPLQHFEYAFNEHPYNHETVQMTLTPVPANATFDITDLRFSYMADYGWEQQWDIVSFELVSREPIIYNVTFNEPLGADVRPYWADAPETDIELWPAGGTDWYPYILAYFRLNLKEGWQWRSNPSGLLWDDDLERGFGPSLIEARTQEELLYNDPEWGYFGTMMEGNGINDNVAYKVRMAADYRSRTFGQTIATGYDDFTMNVTEGWTWMPSPYLYDRLLENIFYADQLTEGMTIISKELGSAEWDGSQWQGDLQVLPTEQSFLLYVPEADGPTKLRFKCERAMAQGHEVAQSRRNVPSSMNAIARRFRDNMTMVAVIDEQCTMINDQWTIEAYVDGELRGMGNWVGGRCFITVHADGGERVSFCLVCPDSGVRYDIDEHVTVSQPRLGSLRRPVELHSAAATQGIGTVLSSEFIVHSYDLLGRPVSNMPKGITIRRSADGTVRKVMNR